MLTRLEVRHSALSHIVIMQTIMILVGMGSVCVGAFTGLETAPSLFVGTVGVIIVAAALVLLVPFLWIHIRLVRGRRYDELRFEWSVTRPLRASEIPHRTIDRD